MLAASFVALQAYYVLDYPGISAALALAIALYTAGAAGHLGWALLIVGWFLVGPILFRIVIDPEPPLPVVGEVIRDASLWLATLLLGALAREHRLLEVERARSERLLRNMLPASIADRLKEREAVIADAFPAVTELFADIPTSPGMPSAAPPRRRWGCSTTCSPGSTR